MRITLADLPGILDAMAERVVPAVEEAHNHTLQQGMQEAVKISSGPYSTAQLRADNHPYAKRDPRPPLPAYIINAQTGEFLAAWGVNDPQTVGDVTSSSLINNSPHGSYLRSGDKSLMIERPVEAHLTEVMEPLLHENVQASLHEALKPILKGKQ